MKCLSSLLLAGLVAGIYLSPVIHSSGGVDPAFQLLRSFSAIEQGRGPYANSALAYSGGKLFGATFQGGPANKGVVFSMSMDGSGYSVLHHFSSLSAGLNTDGAAPASTLTVSGGRIYGSATEGGSNGNGTVYSMNTDGSDFTVLQNFTGVPPNTGQGLHSPYGDFPISGNKLYGVTMLGGEITPLDSTRGRIVSVNVSGGGSTLQNFPQSTNSTHGYQPGDGVAVTGNRIYGTNGSGGSNGRGTLYSLNVDGSDFQVLHNFTSAEGSPYFKITLSGNKLYGVTGSNSMNGGIVYSADLNGSNFQVLKVFTNAEGSQNPTSVVAAGGDIYGTTQTGGSLGWGSIYAMNADGSNFRTLFSFDNAATGYSPTRLILENGYLYGMCGAGGPGQHGTVFRYKVTPDRTLYDYDGDRKSDISVYRPSNGVWYMLRSQAGETAVQFGNATDKRAPADYDGDGKTDVAVYRPSTGAWYVFSSLTNTASVTAFGLAQDLPVPGDYDGDGKADIAIYRGSTGTWWLNRSSAGVIALQFGTVEDFPAPGDYDGDGVNDLVVFRESNGVWYIQRSRDGGFAIQFGNSEDKIAPADYDGDGKMDVGVFRPSQGTWYSVNSSNGAYPVTVFGLGFQDVPVPADYDGDGRADIAVWRPSSGQWWIDRTTAGLTVVQYRLNGDLATPYAFGN